MPRIQADCSLATRLRASLVDLTVAVLEAGELPIGLRCMIVEEAAELQKMLFEGELYPIGQKARNIVLILDLYEDKCSGNSNAFAQIRQLGVQLSLDASFSDEDIVSHSALGQTG